MIGTPKYILKSNRHYPQNLLDITDAPKGFYICGSFKRSDKKAVAIVGSRQMSRYGEKIAKRIAYFLASQGITIVSGLAIGIDTVAHEAAIAAGGRTIAVLGSGIDVIYPSQNFSLAKKISKSGAVVSEFRMGMKPLGRNFLQRNRIISGLSLAVVVIEGKRRSGTLSTTTHAANQGREVFAVPGPIDSPLSDLPNYLIENGARMAKSPEDVMEYLKEIY